MWYTPSMTNTDLTTFNIANPVAYKRDTMIERLRPQEAVGGINEVLETLTEVGHTLSKNQIDALKLRADILWKIIGKVLPDIKMSDGNSVDTLSRVNFIINVGDKTNSTETKII